MDIGFAIVKLFTQIRLANNYRHNLMVAGEWINFSTHTICSICNLQKIETIEHFIMQCPIYSEIRNKYLNNNSYNSLADILKTENKQVIKNLYYFVIKAIKIRSFLIPGVKMSNVELKSLFEESR